MKKIILILLLHFSVFEASEIATTLACAGTLASITADYHFLIALDPLGMYGKKIAAQEKPLVISVAASLKGLSLALLIPKLAISRHRALRFTLHQSGSLFMAMGLCELEVAHEKYEKYKKNGPLLLFPELLKEKAQSNCVAGVLLMVTGGACLAASYAEDGNYVQ